MNEIHPPERLEYEDIVLRRWLPSDARLLFEAIDATRADLERWTPWVIPDPFELVTLEERLTRFHDQFYSGENFIYGIFDSSEQQVLGGVGLYARVGAGALEVGYWIRSDRTGRGLARWSAGELTQVGLKLPGITRIELRCDVRHAASMAIAAKLGFRLREVIRLEEAVDLAVWETTPG